MSEIKIYHHQITTNDNIKTFGFRFDGEDVLSEYGCEECGARISMSYIYIINKLKEANLLVENHKVICCACRNKKFKPYRYYGDRWRFHE